MTNERTVIIGTMRKSIYNVLQSVDESEHFINDVADWMEWLPRNIQSFKYFDEEYNSCTFKGLPSYEDYVIPSHTDPQSFNQIYRWYCMQLISRFWLSYLELVSLETTFNLFPKLHYYFADVVESILRMNANFGDRIMSQHCGHRLEFFILNLMFEMQGQFVTPPFRFNDYKIIEVPKWNEWVDIIDKNAHA